MLPPSLFTWYPCWIAFVFCLPALSSLGAGRRQPSSTLAAVITQEPPWRAWKAPIGEPRSRHLTTRSEPNARRDTAQSERHHRARSDYWCCRCVENCMINVKGRECGATMCGKEPAISQLQRQRPRRERLVSQQQHSSPSALASHSRIAASCGAIRPPCLHQLHGARRCEAPQKKKQDAFFPMYGSFLACAFSFDQVGGEQDLPGETFLQRASDNGSHGSEPLILQI